ncbi:MAG: class I SAM-dependent methyltransferase [Candidatus Heimdallarchaeota archaeon]
MAKKMEEYYSANKKVWDEFAKIHFKSEHYRVKEFLAGETSLKPYELEDIGKEVKGRTLLHLQCHFGLDTLSWAREGAKVTGVDFSSDGVKLATHLAEEINIDAKFIQSNIYDLPDVLDEQFDFVYTSIGVLCWLHDIDRWGEIIAHFLKPGGVFYIAEIHPFSMVFDEEHKKELTLRYDYFHNPEPMEFKVEGTYAEKDAKVNAEKEYEWAHSLSDIVNALLKAGLKLEYLNEYPITVYEAFPFAKQDEDSYYRLKDQKAEIPLIFTIRATK